MTSFERGTTTESLRFPGQYYDLETGLNQNWHRDYAPGLGRYIEADPIIGQDFERWSRNRYKLQENLYKFAYNNPNNLIDTDGLSARHPSPEDIKKWKDLFDKCKGIYDECKGNLEVLFECTGCCKKIAQSMYGDDVASPWWVPYQECQAAMCSNCTE